MKKTVSALLTAIMLLCAPDLLARETIGRMGLGMSNQLANDLPSISFKIMKNRAFGIGGLFGMSTSDSEGGYGAAIKIYRAFFEEPQLQFYGSILGGLIKEKNNNQSDSGFQVDFTLGSEFSFVGLDSLGFSFEFGVSMNKSDDLVIETVGYHFITAAIHFYL
jgi:hypothetical protein